MITFDLIQTQSRMDNRTVFVALSQILLLPNTHIYSKSETQRELNTQNKQVLLQKGLPKGHFELVKVIVQFIVRSCRSLEIEVVAFLGTTRLRGESLGL